MSTLEDIIAQGNRSSGSFRDDNWITCADGFKLSVIAGSGTYCTPRPGFDSMHLSNIHEVPSSYPGPYTHVEVGYPSERPEPWTCHHGRNEYEIGDGEVSSYCSEHPTHPDEGTGWSCYADGGMDSYETVYGYVPVAMVRALIASHGGES